MPTRVELEAFGILIAGGAALAFIVSVVGKRPREATFTLDGAVCDRQGVLEWLDQKIAEGKVTPAAVQQLLLSDTPFVGWIQQNFGQGQLDIADVNELRPICSVPQ